MKTTRLIAFVALAPSAAGAFSIRGEFSLDASRGGGGGIHFTGSPRFKRYTCAACHLDPPGLCRFRVQSDPPDLFATSRYRPGITYRIRVFLDGETRGLDSLVNPNTFALEVLDGRGQPRRDFIPPDDGTVLLAPEGVLHADASTGFSYTQWRFGWRAPARGTGPLDWYLAGVDGDGAAATGLFATDNRGDDVATWAMRVGEISGPDPPPLVLPAGGALPAAAGGCATGGGAPAPLALCAVAACAVPRRRRRFLLALLACLAASCAPVRPWQRGTLARGPMARRPTPEETAIEGSFLTAREGSSGGAAREAGAGCGCE